MRLGIMQPYFLPYVGYFQLISSCDGFVLHDDLKFTKKGWINRNRIEYDGIERIFTLPVKKASDSCQIGERELADDFDPKDLMRGFSGAYRSAPHWLELAELLERILACPDRNLFSFVRNSILLVAESLNLTTDFVVSSSFSLHAELRGEQRVLEICRAMSADHYLNPIGGRDLYDFANFAGKGICLEFLQSKLTPYERRGQEFVPALSVVDQLAYVGLSALKEAILVDFDVVRS